MPLMTTKEDVSTIEIDGKKYVVADPVAKLLYVVSQERDALAGIIEMHKRNTCCKDVTCH